MRKGKGGRGRAEHAAAKQHSRQQQTVRHRVDAQLSNRGFVGHDKSSTRANTGRGARGGRGAYLPSTSYRDGCGCDDAVTSSGGDGGGSESRGVRRTHRLTALQARSLSSSVDGSFLNGYRDGGGGGATGWGRGGECGERGRRAKGEGCLGLKRVAWSKKGVGRRSGDVTVYYY